jgi:hypothetical protein
VDTTASIWDPTGPLVARLASHPQLRRVSVRRKLPGTLVVDVEENLPVALVATNDGLMAYDASCPEPWLSTSRRIFRSRSCRRTTA